MSPVAIVVFGLFWSALGYLLVGRLLRRSQEPSEPPLGSGNDRVGDAPWARNAMRFVVLAMLVGVIASVALINAGPAVSVALAAGWVTVSLVALALVIAFRFREMND